MHFANSSLVNQQFICKTGKKVVRNLRTCTVFAILTHFEGKSFEQVLAKISTPIDAYASYLSFLIELQCFRNFIVLGYNILFNIFSYHTVPT